MTGKVAFEEMLRDRVPSGAVQRLAKYGRLLESWSDHHNLVRASSREELVERHLMEALVVVDRLAPRGRLLDVGSGAGLPGVPILCAKTGWSGVLLEPRTKRWAFLKTVIRTLELDASVVRGRYEEFGEDNFDLITARAVGGHEALLDWAAERLCGGGSIVLWGTVDEAERLRRLGRWTVVTSPVPGLDRGRLLWIQKSST